MLWGLRLRRALSLVVLALWAAFPSRAVLAAPHSRWLQFLQQLQLLVQVLAQALVDMQMLRQLHLGRACVLSVARAQVRAAVREALQPGAR